MNILLGFYYGIGDFISAIPIARELSKTHSITMAIGNQNKGLVDLLEIENIEIIYYPLFSMSKISEIFEFITILKDKKFDKVIISPHAQNAVTSWKIPFMAKYIKGLNTEVIGAIGDKNCFLYDKKIPIDKSIPLMQREIDFIKLIGLVDMDKSIEIENIFRLKHIKKDNYIVIHPGASKPLKEWNLNYYQNLVNMLINNTNLNIVFIGLEQELFKIKTLIKESEKIEFFSGSFKNVIEKTLECSCIITMDSGFGHIASALGLNHIVLIGSANPKHITPIFTNTEYININKLSCQPCNGHECKIRHNYCMDLIDPYTVYNKIIKRNTKCK